MRAVVRGSREVCQSAGRRAGVVSIEEGGAWLRRCGVGEAADGAPVGSGLDRCAAAGGGGMTMQVPQVDFDG
jgi:hypothetical protein